MIKCHYKTCSLNTWLHVQVSKLDDNDPLSKPVKQKRLKTKSTLPILQLLAALSHANQKAKLVIDNLQPQVLKIQLDLVWNQDQKKNLSK